jgi:peptidoglycan hydrolase-like protein with peptidoglycan-binding domain
MRIKLVCVIFLAALAPVRGDDTVANVQQALKDQGFYYGEITGQKTSDTTAAIRRYQIRNGLQITGELNDETLRSLKNTASTSASAVAPTARPTTSVAPDLNDESAGERAEARPAPVQPFVTPPQSRPTAPAGPPIFEPSSNSMFTGTPYEGAPPEVQRKVIVDAQKTLARRGLFKNEIDGVYGPNLEFSLRAYQSRVGLNPTGRLDLETLAALELLPGAHMPVFVPRRSMRPEVEEPPVRGEWIRP